MPKGTSHYFNIGDSSTQPLGLCARLTTRAHTSRAAILAKFRALLRENESMQGIELFTSDTTNNRDQTGIEYVRLFINPEQITTAHLSLGDAEEIDELSEDELSG